MVDGGRQISQGDHRNAAQRSPLAAARLGQEYFEEIRAKGELRDRQASPYRTDSAVEPELAAEESAVQAFGWQVAVGRELGERDGQVEMIALLAEIGGCQIDGDGFRWQVEATILERRAHPLTALANSRVRQSDDLGLRKSVVNVDLDLNGSSLYAPRGCGK